MYKIKQEYGLNRQIHKQKLTVNGNYQLHKKNANKMQTKAGAGKKRNDGIEENCQCCQTVCRRFNPMATNLKVSKRLSRSYQNWERGLEGKKRTS